MSIACRTYPYPSQQIIVIVKRITKIITKHKKKIDAMIWYWGIIEALQTYFTLEPKV